VTRSPVARFNSEVSSFSSSCSLERLEARHRFEIHSTGIRKGCVGVLFECSAESRPPRQTIPASHPSPKGRNDWLIVFSSCLVYAAAVRTRSSVGFRKVSRSTAPLMFCAAPNSLPHRIDESPAGYSSAGWSPPDPPPLHQPNTTLAENRRNEVSKCIQRRTVKRTVKSPTVSTPGFTSVPVNLRARIFTATPSFQARNPPKYLAGIFLDQLYWKETKRPPAVAAGPSLVCAEIKPPDRKSIGINGGEVNSFFSMMTVNALVNY